MDPKYGHHEHHGLHFPSARALHDYEVELGHVLTERRFWELVGISAVIAVAITLLVAVSNPQELAYMWQAYGM